MQGMTRREWVRAGLVVAAAGVLSMPILAQNAQNAQDAQAKDWSRIAGNFGDVKVYFAGHTRDSDYRDVDVAITEEHPGASVYYWRLAG